MKEETGKTEARHTPGQVEVLGNNTRYIFADNGKLIAAVCPGNAFAEETEGNAAHIALTWNCHDELVAALENLITNGEDYTNNLFCIGCSGEGMDEDGYQTENFKHDAGCPVMQAKAIVARAKGGE